MEESYGKLYLFLLVFPVPNSLKLYERCMSKS